MPDVRRAMEALRDGKVYTGLVKVEARTRSDEGVFLDCVTHPGGQPVRAQQLAFSMGGTSSLYLPCAVGSVALAFYADGDGTQAYVLGGLQDDEHPLPAGAGEDDAWFEAASGAAIQIRAGLIGVGGDSLSLALWEPIVGVLLEMITVLIGHGHPELDAPSPALAFGLGGSPVGKLTGEYGKSASGRSSGVW